MQISRRDALMGAGAAAAVAGVPGAVQGEDAALLAQVARFYCLYEAWRSVWAKNLENRAQIEAMSDCPPITIGGFEKRDAFLEAHGAYRFYDEANRLGELAGPLASAIMATPAKTFKGAVEKFKIAHLAVGSYPEDGDEWLEGYQDQKRPWMASVAGDFERLAGEA